MTDKDIGKIWQQNNTPIVRRLIVKLIQDRSVLLDNSDTIGDTDPVKEACALFGIDYGEYQEEYLKAS